MNNKENSCKNIKYFENEMLKLNIKLDENEKTMKILSCEREELLKSFNEIVDLIIDEREQNIMLKLNKNN